MTQTPCPAAVPGAAGSGPSVGEVFRRFGPDYLRTHVLTPAQGKVLRNIMDCRTAALGGHVHQCTRCDYAVPTYNSCRNRHCPICQGAAAVRWLAARLERLVPTHHFHTVFTVPAELRPLALANPRIVYDLLFAAASETLLELARDRWDALPAITAVLHTWTRTMEYHPHVHCVVTGGGLAQGEESWVSCRPSFLFPVKVLSALYRGKFMDGLIRAYDDGELQFVGGCAELADPEAFASLRRRLYRAAWVTYAKPPFGSTDAVVRYLSLYTHRVAISSSRVLSVADDEVVIRTRNGGTCRLAPEEFLRRFLLHVLPARFRKIRHYGLAAPCHANTLLPIAQRLAGALSRSRRRAHVEVVLGAGGSLDRRCPACGEGVLVRMRLRQGEAVVTPQSGVPP